MGEKKLVGRETRNSTWFWVSHSKKCNLGQICNNIEFCWPEISMVILVLYISSSFSGTFFLRKCASHVGWLLFTLKTTSFYMKNKGRNGIVQEAVMIMVIRRDCHIWKLLFHQNCLAHSQIQTEFGHKELPKREVAIVEHRQLLKWRNTILEDVKTFCILVYFVGWFWQKLFFPIFCSETEQELNTVRRKKNFILTLFRVIALKGHL